MKHLRKSIRFSTKKDREHHPPGGKVRGPVFLRAFCRRNYFSWSFRILGRALRYSRLSMAMKRTLIPLGQAASHS